MVLEVGDLCTLLLKSLYRCPSNTELNGKFVDLNVTKRLRDDKGVRRDLFVVFL